MFIYLLLLLATATSPELQLSDGEQQELQEIITLLSQEEDAQDPIVAIKEDKSKDEVTVAEQESPITISNSIQPEMLVYKHWTGTYSPETFTVFINGTEISQGNTVALPSKSSTIEVGYTYSFMNGMRTGGKTVEYQLDKNTTQAQITFSWKDDWRVIVDNAKPIKEVAST